MACTETKHEGQFPIVCQICENETQLKWKCIDCEMLMCNKCKEKIHPKFKFAGDHRISNIKEVGVENQENEKSVDFSKIKCIKHPGQVVTLYCGSCDQLACASCIVQIHKKHDLMEICDGYTIKIEKLKEAKLKIEEEKDNLNMEIRKLVEIKTTKESQYNEVNQNILIHETVLINAVKEYGKNLRSDLEGKYQSIQKSIDQEIDHIYQLEKDAENKILKLDLHIDTKNAEDVFKNLPAEKEMILVKKSSINWTNITLPQFIPRKLNSSDIGLLQIETTEKIKTNSGETASINSSRTIVNETKTKTEESVPVNSSLKVVKKYDTGISSINKIVACDDGLLWLLSWSNNELLKFKPCDKILQVMSSYNLVVYSMALTPANDLLFSTNESRLSIIYNDTGKLRKSKYNVAPLRAGIIRASGDYVIVGAHNTDNMTHGRRAVIVMDKEGNHVIRHERDVQNKPILNNIIDLTVSHEGTFVVDGLIGMNSGYRVVVFKHGGHTSTYEGHPNINTEIMAFAPVHIATAPSINIVVYDAATNAFHILNNYPQLIKHLYLHEIGIHVQREKLYVSSMCFSTDKWFIGLSRWYENAKLYKLEISGCPELEKETE